MANNKKTQAQRIKEGGHARRVSNGGQTRSSGISQAVNKATNKVKTQAKTNKTNNKSTKTNPPLTRTFQAANNKIKQTATNRKTAGKTTNTAVMATNKGKQAAATRAAGGASTNRALTTQSPMAALQYQAKKQNTGTTKAEKKSRVGNKKVVSAIEKQAMDLRKQKAERAQKVLNTSTDRRARAGARQDLMDALYPLSERDRKLSYNERQKIQEAKYTWDLGKTLENQGYQTKGKEAQTKSHDYAEAQRRVHGYSGGASGDDEILPELTGADRYLSAAAKEMLRGYKLDYDYGKRTGDRDLMNQASTAANHLRQSEPQAQRTYRDRREAAYTDAQRVLDQQARYDRSGGRTGMGHSAADLRKARQTVQEIEAEFPEISRSAASRAGLTLKGAGQNSLGSLQETLGWMLNPGESGKAYRSRETGDWADTRQLEKAANEMYNRADRNLQKGQKATEAAKFGLGRLGDVAVDVGTFGAQMVPEMALGAVTGGVGGLAALGARAFGGAANEARHAGASMAKQGLYGLAAGGVEIATEKLFSAAAPFRRAYGGGIRNLDGAIEKAIGRVVRDPAAANLVTAATTEGLEEIISDAVNPILRSIYNGKSVAQNYSEEDISQWLYDGMIGGILGGLGGVTGQIGRRAPAVEQAQTPVSSPQVPQAESLPMMNQTERMTRARFMDQAAAQMATPVTETVVAPQVQQAAPAQQATTAPVAAQAAQKATPVTENLVQQSIAQSMAERPAARRQARQDLGYDPMGADPLAQAALEMYGEDWSKGLPEQEAQRPAAMDSYAAQAADQNYLDSLAREMESRGEPVEENAYNDYMQELLANPAAAQQTAAAAPVQQRTEVQRQVVEQPTQAAQEPARQAESNQAAAERQLLTAGRSMGQSGQRALVAAYEEGDEVPGYFGGFSVLYQAGRTGRDPETVQSPLVQRLSPAQKMAAYTAGQNDRQLDAAVAQREGRQERKPGLLRDENAELLDSVTATRLDNLAKAVGTSVRIVETAEGVNGWYDSRTGEIVVAADAENGVMVTAKHEITHRMQELAPKEYARYKAYASRSLGKGHPEELIRSYQEWYQKQADVALSEDEALDEIAADYTEAMADTPELFRDLAQADRPVAKSVLRATRDFLKKIFSRNKESQSRQAAEDYGVSIQQLEKAADLWEQTLKAAARQSRKEQKKAPEKKRYSIRKGDWKNRSYRLHKSEDGMSHTGHAMFSDRYGSLEGAYSGNLFTTKHEDLTDVEDYLGEIAQKIEEDYEAGDLPDGLAYLIEEGMSYEEAARQFDPEDVVDSAQAWDDEELVEWFWDRVGEPNDIGGLKTQDGAIVFDPDLIENHGDPDEFWEEHDPEKLGVQYSARGGNGLLRKNERKTAMADKKKFSLRKPVEYEKNLIAMHNLTEEKLMGDIRLGGFPMPSIAVTKADIPHTNFGPITLVMDKSAVDPEADKRNDVYSADAWTPTFPEIEYEADDDVAARVRNTVYDLADNVAPAFQKELKEAAVDLEGSLQRHGGEAGLVESLQDNYGLKAAYLEEQGRHVDEITQQKEKEKGYNESRAEKYKAILDVLGTEDPAEIGKIPLKELRSQHGADLEKAFPGMTKSALRMGSILKQVQAYLTERESGPAYETVTDTAAMKRAVDQTIDTEAFEDWLRDLYQGIEKSQGVYNYKELFTPSGNRRSFQQTHEPVTLEGIVKAMRSQNGGKTQNTSHFLGVQTLRAGMAERMRSIPDMHAKEGRLQHLSQEEAEQIKKDLNDRLYKIIEGIAEKAPEQTYRLYDSIGEIIQEVADSKKITIDRIKKTFAVYQHKLTNPMATEVRDLLFDVSQMPVNIFEAKPARAVGFDEVLAAVVPTGTSQQLREALEGQGVTVLEYEADNEADRMEKVNSVPNARFSTRGGNRLKQNARERELARENAYLKELLGDLRSQVKEGRIRRADERRTREQAKALIERYDATMNKKDLTAKLQALYDGIAFETDSWEDTQKKAEAIGREIAEGALVEKDSLYNQYPELRKYLRETQVRVSESLKREVADFADWRKSLMGKLRLTTGETSNADQVYEELAQKYPEFFSAERDMREGDMLLRLGEVAEMLQDRGKENPYEAQGISLDDIANEIGTDIIDSFRDVLVVEGYSQREKSRLREARHQDREKAREMVEETRNRGQERWEQERADRRAEIRLVNNRYWDRWEKEKQERREGIKKARQQAQEQIQRMREQRNREVKQISNKYWDMRSKNREARTATELRERILRHARSLSQKLLRPNDKQHIPQQLRTAIATALHSIDLTSSYTIDKDTGKPKKGPEGDPTQGTKAWLEVKAAYEEILKPGGEGENMVIDPDLQDNLNTLAGLEGKPIMEMSRHELATVWETLQAIEASVRSADKAFGKARFESISEIALALHGVNGEKKPVQNLKGVLGEMPANMMTPQAFFHRMGKPGDAVFDMLRRGQDTYISLLDSARAHTKEVLEQSKAQVEAWEKETHTFELGNGARKLTMTTAQIMSLYKLLKRKQAQEHILIGGIRPTNRKKNALRDDQKPEPVIISFEEASRMVSALTDEQMDTADALQQYMAKDLAREGNRASMEVYGYEKFGEPDYFPIQTDRNQVARDPSKETKAQSVAGRGFTKTTAPKANNAVMIDSIFNVYANHVNEMLTYAAWLAPLENLRRIQNYTYRDEEGERRWTMKAVIERTFGRVGNTYWNKLSDDLNQGIKASDTGNPFDRFTANYKVASISANIRVFIQQPTAVLRAASMVNPAYLAAGALKPIHWNRVKKYSPIAVWKDWGYFDINTGRQIRNVILDDDTKAERAKQAFMAPAGAMDSLAWGQLWNAVELETAAKHKELKEGTDAFYKQVAQRFGEVIDRTQVVDGILQRSQFMRKPDSLSKMATSFMAEPTKIWNMLAQAAYDLQTAPKGRKAAARKQVSRTVFALVLSCTVNAAAQSLVDGLRDDDRDKKYLDKVLEKFTGYELTGEGEAEAKTPWAVFSGMANGNLGAAANPLGYLPFGKDVLSLMQGYDIKRMDMDGISKVIKSAQAFQKAMNGDGNYTVKWAAANLLADTSRLFGLPVANLKRDLLAVAQIAIRQTGELGLEFELDKLLYLPGGGRKGNYLDLAVAAKEDGDTALFGQIAEYMGKSQSELQDAIDSREKTALKKTKGYADAVAGIYDPAWESIQGSKAFQNMSAAQQADVAAKLKTYADSMGVFQVSDGKFGLNDEAKKIQEVMGSGVALSDFLMLKVLTAKTQGEKDKNGKTIQNSKALKIREIVKKSGIQLTEDQQKTVLEALGVGKTVQKLSDNAAANKAKAVERKSESPMTIAEYAQAIVNGEIEPDNPPEAEAAVYTGGGDGSYHRPVAGGSVTSGFGPRSRPTAGASSNHMGVDIGVPIGTPVTAAAGGQVINVSRSNARGIYVDVQHPDGVITRYQHLSQANVAVGQQVNQDQNIALSGNTGVGTGPHLHVEVIVNGRNVDPRSYIQF